MKPLLAAATLLWLVGCQAGPKGDTGPAGPAGAKGETGTPGAMGSMGLPGAQGPAGDAGPTGAAGMNGAPGQVVVLAAADGGSLVVDGGLVIVAGPQGAPGMPGAPGQVVVLSMADGGSVAVDGGIAIVTGPPGPPAGLRLLGPDGGLLGYATGTDFYSTAAQCFTGVPGYSPQAVTSFARLCWTGVSCTGTPMMPALTLTVRDTSIGATWPASAYGRCFYGGTRNSLGAMESRFYRLVQPVTRVQMSFLSCGAALPQHTCDPVTFSAGAYPVEELPTSGLVPTDFPPLADGTTLTP